MSHRTVPPFLGSHAPPLLPFVLKTTGIGEGESRRSRGLSRWEKRFLLVGIGLLLLLGISWATSPLPKLLRAPQSIATNFDTSIQSIAQQVDKAINADIASHGLSKAKATDWRAITRRISLALIGNGLSLEEIRVLEKCQKRYGRSGGRNTCSKTDALPTI